MKPVVSVSGEGNTKTLGQLQAQEDDEERFQADLKKAVRQSLGNVLTGFTYMLLMVMLLFLALCLVLGVLKQVSCTSRT